VAGGADRWVAATIVSAICVFLGDDALEHHTGGRDGGLCGMVLVVGCVAAVVSWPIVFGVVWGLVRLANRRD
jgi:hypothetical protein